MSVAGYNPLRWECAKTGCYNVVLRPKIEVFAECFPGKIAMMDIDGTAEVNGCFLFLEFKTRSPSIPTGQRIYFERLTTLSQRIWAVVVLGNAETMDLKSYCAFHGGKMKPWRLTNTADFKARLKAWAEWARKQ